MITELLLMGLNVNKLVLFKPSNNHIYGTFNMSKKVVISQSIMWAAAILVVSIVQEKQFAIMMVALLATVSLIYLKKEMT